VSEIYTANPNKKQNKQLSGLYIIETINRTFNETDKLNAIDKVAYITNTLEKKYSKESLLK
jgi:hypothetical protein